MSSPQPPNGMMQRPSLVERFDIDRRRSQVQINVDSNHHLPLINNSGNSTSGMLLSNTSSRQNLPILGGMSGMNIYNGSLKNVVASVSPYSVHSISGINLHSPTKQNSIINEARDLAKKDHHNQSNVSNQSSASSLSTSWSGQRGVLANMNDTSKSRINMQISHTGINDSTEPKSHSIHDRPEKTMIHSGSKNMEILAHEMEDKLKRAEEILGESNTSIDQMRLKEATILKDNVTHSKTNSKVLKSTESLKDKKNSSNTKKTSTNQLYDEEEHSSTFILPPLMKKTQSVSEIFPETSPHKTNESMERAQERLNARKPTKVNIKELTNRLTNQRY